jgi:lipopolysaccharide biosynthesis protein
MNRDMKPDEIHAIAFYLPQYHPVPENDEWWGKGFTEWTNVTRAQSQFPGHYQPHLPSDLGFYDLRLPEAREAQADLAREYGIHGFCYYHYWFNGRRILERPFQEVLESKEPELPFCLCWANENWTRIWDGGESKVLLQQNYNPDDDIAHIKSLIPAFRDERYIRIDGKPLFLVYKSKLLPDPIKTTEIWRETLRKEGLGEIYLARVEAGGDSTPPSHHGFDASVEFQPTTHNSGPRPFESKIYKMLSKLSVIPKGLTDRTIFDYDELVKTSLKQEQRDHTLFRGVTPSWDNSARRPDGGGLTIIGSTPEKYQYWLEQTIESIPDSYEPDERIVFINAWNEWAEGNHLEPDQKWGRRYLEATRNALNVIPGNSTITSPLRNGPSPFRINDYMKYQYQKRIGWRLK